MRLSTAIFIGLLFFGNVDGFAQEYGTNPPYDAELKKLAQTAIDLASPSIVRFAYGEKSHKYHFGCGVIVSPEGHIAVSGPVHAVLDPDLLELRLADGRVVNGQALGWSSEFGFGMLKITEAGPWPFIKVNGRPKVGQVCIAIGYARNTDQDHASQPDVRLGLVTRVSCAGWLTTSHRSKFNAHPVFDLHGELIGLNCIAPVNGDAILVAATLITAHWDDIVAGKNLDRVRLFSSTRIAHAALTKAKLASVRITEIGKKESLVSGTIVTPDGYIITCGHHDRMPGEKLQVLLQDGRSTTATVLGTNLVADVGVMKMTEDGPWPPRAIAPCWVIWHDGAKLFCRWLWSSRG